MRRCSVRLERLSNPLEPRRSTRIREIESKKASAITIPPPKQRQEQNAIKAGTTKKAMPPKTSVKPAHRCSSRSKTISTPPNAMPPKEMPARRCNSRSQSMSAPPKAMPPNTVPPKYIPPKAMVPKSSVNSARRCNSRSQSLSAPPKAVPPKTEPPKSSVKSAHRCSSRSKSVSFDLVSSSVADASNGTLKNDTPVDLTVHSKIGKELERAKSLSNQKSVAQKSDECSILNSSGSTSSSSNGPSTSGVRGQNLTSQDKLMYENRMESLVVSNEKKIARIKVLMAERDSMESQIKTLHAINRSLAATVDEYNSSSTQSGNGDEQVADVKAEIANIKGENANLRTRNQRLNAENFQLRSNNENLMACVDTYSKNVLSEHNYNMNF